MYYYEVGYGSYEDSYYVTLTHAEQLTEAQLTELVTQAMEQTALRLAKSTKHFDYKLLHVSDLVADGLFTEEMKKLGFAELTYQVKFSMFGWESIFNEEHSWLNQVGGKETQGPMMQRVADVLKKHYLEKTGKELTQEELERYFNEDLYKD